MDTKANIELLLLYYTHNRSITTTIRKYCTQQNIKTLSARPNKRTLQRLVKKFEENGTLDDLSRSGRGDAIKRDDFEAVALAIETIKKHGTLPTTRAISTQVNLSNATVHKIMRKEL